MAERYNSARSHEPGAADARSRYARRMRHVIVVLHSCLPGREADYEAAYERHLREVAAHPDVLGACRGELVTKALAPFPEPGQSRLTVYDVMTDDPAAWLAEVSSGEAESSSSPQEFMEPETLMVGCYAIVDEA
jgi:hypothetical protein